MADGQIVIDVNLDRDGFKRQIGGLKGDATSAFAGLRDAMQGPIAAAKMVVQAIGAIGGALNKLATASGQVEKYKATLETMLGSQEAAIQRFKEMSDFAAKTPFELPDVVELGNRLQSIGKYSQEAMRDLGDLAAASGKPIDQVANAFAKLATGQKGEAVNMFRDLLISTDDWVAATGKGITKSGELLATTEEMVAVLPKILQSKGFSGMMEKQSKTWLGIVSNLNDAMFRLSVSFGDILTGPLKGIVKDISASVDAMNAFVTENVSLREEIDGWSAILTSAWERMKEFTIDPALLDAIKEMSVAFRELAEVTIPLIGEAFSLQASNIGKVFKYIVDTLAWVASQISLYVTFYKSLFTGDFKKAIASFVLIIIGWAENVVKIIETMVEKSLSAIVWLADKVNKLLPKDKQIKIEFQDLGLSAQLDKWKADLEAIVKGSAGKEGPQAAPGVAAAPIAPKPATAGPAKKVLSADEQKALDDRLAYQEKWAEKLADLQNDTLEEQRDAEIAYAESIGAETASIREYYFIKIAERNEAAEKEAAEKAVEAQREAAEESRRIWDETISEITGGIDAIAEGVNEIGGDAASGMVDLFSFIADLISAAAKDFMDVGQDIQLVVSLISLAGANMPALFEDVTSGVVELATMLMSALGPIFDAVMQTVLAFMPIFKPIVALVAELAKLVAPFIPVIAMIEQLWVNLSGIQVLLPIIVSAVQLLANAFLWFYNDIIRPVYNFLVLVFNKIYNAFANFFNSLLAAVDAIPGVDLSYRMRVKAETEGQLGKITSPKAPAEAGGVTEFTDDLEDANEKLRKNRNLFTKAAEAAAAYQAVMTSVTETVADFYDGLKDIGSDLAGMIIDSLTSGFDNDDFLFALEEYITQSILQAAVFTDAFMAQVADIGAKLARAIATGDTGQIEALKNQLSELYTAAAATAQTVTGAVSQAFGSYAVGTLALPQDGLIYAHAGEAVIPSGLMAEAMARGLTIAPTASLIGGAQQITINLKNALTVDGREIASAAFRYQDELVGAAYGG